MSAFFDRYRLPSGRFRVVVATPIELIVPADDEAEARGKALSVMALDARVFNGLAPMHRPAVLMTERLNEPLD